MKQREYVRWLRALVVLAGLALLALVGALVPTLAGEIARSNPELAYLYWPGVLFVWATAAPVYAALAQAWLVCGSIGAGQAFCQRNVGRLKTMGLCMVIDAVRSGAKDFIVKPFKPDRVLKTVSSIVGTP